MSYTHPTTMVFSALKANVSYFRLCRSTRLFSTTTYLRNTIPLPDSELKASPKIENLVNEISKLTLIEVSELNTVLKEKLNLKDIPAFGSFVSAGAAPAQEEEVVPEAAKSSYTVRLEKFDDTKKVALIKEIRSLLEDMNLVQAKKFIESAPVVVKADIGKEEAEKLQEALTKHGAVITID